MARVVISGHGLAIEVPSGWEARIFRRADAAPVLHAASFPLHDHDGDFGAAATGRMRGDDRFLALVEYRPDGRLRAGHGLFAPASRPVPRAPDFSPRQLQVTRAGQLGWQRFFTVAGRPCCVYAVVQPARLSAGRLVTDLARVLDTLEIAPGTVTS